MKIKMNSNEPLAFRMRPRTLEEYVGQEHVLGKGKILYRTIKADRLSSIILFGPPGCGKTSLARVISETTKYKFYKINAVTSGVADIKRVVEETKNFINLPTNIKILVLFTVIIYGLSLILKQGAYLYFHNKKHATHDSKTAEMFFLSSSGAIYTGIYVINLIYYLTINPIFSILMSLFFVALSVILAVACGYFKNSGHEMSYELDKYEYREDFEDIMSEYRLWIERYINTLSDNKINNIKDRLFNLNLKSVWEIILGIITAPFLAYGVSITLAMCFPDAAGWIRISGLRLSPVFLTLATFMIVFAFFSFVNAFLCIRKLQASTVIKNDGFSDYQSHGVNIMGIQGAKKLESEKNRSLIIGCAIIFIEFTMNTSYFCTEIGGDLQGILLSIIAASVPTALLMAETYMLSQTKFDISAGNDLLAKRD